MTQAEKQAEIATRAGKIMENLDAVLLQSQKDLEASTAEDAELVSIDERSGSGESGDTQAEQEQTEDGEEEMQQGSRDTTPGNQASKRGSGGELDPESDIVVRQVCDLAEQEENPEVKQKLTQRCADMKKDAKN